LENRLNGTVLTGYCRKRMSLHEPQPLLERSPHQRQLSRCNVIRAAGSAGKLSVFAEQLRIMDKGRRTL